MLLNSLSVARSSFIQPEVKLFHLMILHLMKRFFADGESKMKNPSPEKIRIVRDCFGQTQTEAGATIYVSMRAWQNWELGYRPMPPGLWELYLLKAIPQCRGAQIILIKGYLAEMAPELLDTDKPRR
jgi:putative transcriptional regulator